MAAPGGRPSVEDIQARMARLCPELCVLARPVTDASTLFRPYPKLKPMFEGNAKAARKLRKNRGWVATEKVHGANLQLVCGRGSEVIVPAKRGSVLGADEPFFGLRSSGLLATLSPLVTALCTRLCAKDADIDGIAVFGELCGGTPAIQPGVFYSPELTYMVFDIALVTNGVHAFLPFDAMTAASAEAGLFCTSVLARGEYGAMLDMDLGFGSTLPGRLGCSEAAPAENIAEGIVVRPESGDQRVLVKKKGPGFSEVEAAGRGYVRDVTGGERGKELWWELQGWVTRMRKEGARGKVGEVGGVNALCVADAVCDWLEGEEEGFWEGVDDVSARDLFVLAMTASEKL